MLVARVTHPRIVRNIEDNRPDEAIGLCERYVRVFRSEPWGWLMLDEVIATFDPDTERRGAKLREAFRRIPHSRELGYRHASHFIRRYEQMKEESALSEAEDVIRVMTDLWGEDNPEVLSLRAWVAHTRSPAEALPFHLKAVEAVSRASSADTRFPILLGLLAYPQHLDTFRSALLEEVERNGLPMAWLWLALCWERDDPSRAKRYLATARELWGGPQDTFDAKVELVRQDINRDAPHLVANRESD